MTAILWIVGLSGFYLIFTRETLVPKAERFTGKLSTED